MLQKLYWSNYFGKTITYFAFDHMKLDLFPSNMLPFPSVLTIFKVEQDFDERVERVAY